MRSTATARSVGASLYGGFDGSGYRDDTWEWDGTKWAEIDVPGPPRRSSRAMVWDAGRGAVLLFGGWNGSSYLGDTWAYDGTSWTEVATDGPPGRYRHGLAYDDDRGAVVLYGGWNGGALGDTWEWDGHRWTPIEPPGPGRRERVQLVYDGGRDVFVTFGGSAALQSFGDTWEYVAAPITLNQTSWRQGEVVELHATGLEPGESVHFLLGVDGQGSGPCPPALAGLCVDVVEPGLLGIATADATGLAIWSRTVPTDRPELQVTTQGVVPRRDAGVESVKSFALTAPVVAP